MAEQCPHCETALPMLREGDCMVRASHTEMLCCAGAEADLARLKMEQALEHLTSQNYGLAEDALEDVLDQIGHYGKGEADAAAG